MSHPCWMPSDCRQCSHRGRTCWGGWCDWICRGKEYKEGNRFDMDTLNCFAHLEPVKHDNITTRDSLLIQIGVVKNWDCEPCIVWCLIRDSPCRQMAVRSGAKSNTLSSVTRLLFSIALHWRFIAELLSSIRFGPTPVILTMVTFAFGFLFFS